MQMEIVEFIVLFVIVPILIVILLPFLILLFKESVFMELATAITNVIGAGVKCWLKAWRIVFGKEDKQ